MKKLSLIISRLMVAILIFTILPTKSVQAVENIKIISTTNITKEDAKAWATSKNASAMFINLADIYWDNYEKHGGVNPAIAYVQSALETFYGKFGGVLDESYYNPCGMKNPQGGDDKDPNAHYRFNNWDEGVKAHLDHLALYAGAQGYPRTDTFDPRHQSWLLGKATTVLDLEGLWASSSGYGAHIIKLYNEILAYAKKPERLAIDTPQNGYIVNNNKLTVSGWALNDSGVKEIKVYIDNKYYKNATIGLSRGDVDKAYPGYPGGANSGYSVDLDLTTLSIGKKQIKVEQIGNDGSKMEVVREIDLQRKSAKLAIDTPQNGQVVEENKITIKGWALNDSGVKEIKVYVNNQYYKNATIGLSRNDVDKAYPGYPNGANSGYSVDLDLNALSSGKKQIKVEQIGNDGSKVEVTREINLKRKVAKLAIDTPQNGQVINDSKITIKGWALNDSGVKEIKVYVDNQYYKNATMGLSRDDVDKAYPGYPDGKNSGYSVDLDLNNLQSGKKQIKVEQIGNDGSKVEIIREINLQKKPVRLAIDTPQNGYIVNNNKLTVSGWALNDSGVKEVKIYVDNKYYKNATIGLPRSDVDKAYPGYLGGSNSGYSAELDLTTLPSGNKVIKVELIGNDGSKGEVSRTIRLEKKPVRLAIDSPQNGYTVTDNKIKVSGWALNDSGIKEIKVYVDNKYNKSAQIGLSRSDVDRVYPGYPGGANSGYSIELDLTSLSAGKKQIKVEQIGYDGTKSEVVREVYLQKKVPMIAIDNLSNNTTIYDKTIAIKGWALNDSGVKEINAYIDNAYVGSTKTGLVREDVDRAYPGYPNGNNSGYELKLDLSKVLNGKRKIVIESIGYDGTSIKIEREVLVKVNKVIVIDPGHGGKDPGAVATHNSVRYEEAKYNIQIALKLKEELDNEGYNTVMTVDPIKFLSSSTPTVSLQDRASIANTLDADLFVSVHQNSASSSASGVEVWYSSDGNRDVVSKPGAAQTSKTLASDIAKNISSNVGFANRKEKDGRLYVTRMVTMPSVLVECGFISNLDEAKKLSDENIQKTIARSIASSIKGLFKNS